MYNPHKKSETLFSLYSLDVRLHGETMLQEYVKRKYITDEEADLARQVMKQEIESDDVLLSVSVVFGDMEHFKCTGLMEEDTSTSLDVLRTDTTAKVTPYTGTFTSGLKKYDDKDMENKIVVEATMEDEFILVVKKSAMTQYVNSDKKTRAGYSMIWMYLPNSRIW